MQISAPTKLNIAGNKTKIKNTLWRWFHKVEPSLQNRMLFSWCVSFWVLQAGWNIICTYTNQTRTLG